MQKPLICDNCHRQIDVFDPSDWIRINHTGEAANILCRDCQELHPILIDWARQGDLTAYNFGRFPEGESTPFNKPEHYHKYDIDTIEFLKRGFPPQVAMSFLIGNVIKYAQRAEHKNGLEDYDKMVDYAERARDWYEENLGK